MGIFPLSDEYHRIIWIARCRENKLRHLKLKRSQMRQRTQERYYEQARALVTGGIGFIVGLIILMSLIVLGII